MSEQDKPFVVNDRRKFRMDGELREPAQEKPAEAPAPVAETTGKVLTFDDAPAHREHAHYETAAPQTHSTVPIPINSAHTVTPVPEPDENAPAAATTSAEQAADENLPPPPTAEEVAQVKLAYEATAERLDTMMRATNPGGEHLPPMDFTRMVQSIYMSAMMQLGAGTPQGEQARVDLLGAKQSIDMLAVIEMKSEPGLEATEKRLIESALFELRMGFLEFTQMLARQAAAKQGAPGGASPFGGPAAPGGPRIVT